MVHYREVPTNGKNGEVMPVSKYMPKRAELHSRIVLPKTYCVHTSLEGLV